MKYIFDQWEKTLNEYKACVTKELNEIRAAKAEMQQMKTEIMNAMADGYYRRDEKRIILSAPEIIIGDVDKDGNLWMDGEHSKVIIRSNDISIEGVASSLSDENKPDEGTITCRASSIKQMAVDPGPSGKDNIVFPEKSEIVTLGQAVKMSTIDTNWVMQPHDKTAPQGVTIHSGSQLTIDASASQKTLSDTLKDLKDARKNELDAKKASTVRLHDDVKRNVQRLRKLHEDAEKLLGNSLEDVRTNSMELFDYRNQIEKMLPAVYNSVKAFIEHVDEVARLSWDHKMLAQEETAVNEKAANFEKEATGASININAEKITVDTKDGDENIRVNEEAGIVCNAKKIEMTALDKEGKLLSKGKFTMRVPEMDFSTAERTVSEDGKKVTVEPNGKMFFQTKQLDVAAYKLEEQPQENADPKITFTEMPEDSIVNVMMNKTLISSLDHKGDVVGMVALNAKDVIITSDNKDLEKGDSKKQPENTGKVSILAQKLVLGTKDENNKTAETIMTTEKLTVSAATSAEINEGEGKAVVKMTEKDVEVTADMLTAKSQLTVEKKTEFKDSVKGTDADFNKVTGKNLVGPTINDH